MNSISNELITYIIKTEVQNALADAKGEILNKTHLLSLEILESIKDILSRHYRLSDFEIVEEIVSLLEKYDIDCGNCHDFG